MSTENPSQESQEEPNPWLLARLQEAPPTEFYNEQLGVPFDAREAYQRIRSGRRRVERNLVKHGAMLRQAADITEVLWELAQTPRAEDDNEQMAVVDGVTLQLLPGEIPHERIRRAMEIIFDVTIRGDVTYTRSPRPPTDPHDRWIRLRVTRPFPCLLEMHRTTSEHNDIMRTLEAFTLLEYNAEEARRYISHAVGGQCRHQSLRDFLLNFKSKESLLLAVAAMLDGSGPTRAKGPKRPDGKRQYRGIRIRRPHDTRSDDADAAAGGGPATGDTD